MQKNGMKSSQWSEADKEVYSVTVEIPKDFLVGLSLYHRHMFVMDIFSGEIDKMLKGMK